MMDKLKDTVHCVYLHGFASSPNSSKAKYFADKVREIGQSVDVPDLNTPDFQHMTLTSQIEALDSCLERVPQGQPVVLFGSSMGGLVATLKAQKSSQVKAIVLLAPGFGLGPRCSDLVGGEARYENWASDGEITVFHYAFNREMKFNYDFAVDLQKYETSNLHLNIPALVIHGLNDEVVPFKESEDFYELNPENVELHLLDSDHQLASVLPEMWDLSKAFLLKHGYIG
jgi:uncharacterized protein